MSGRSSLVGCFGLAVFASVLATPAPAASLLDLNFWLSGPQYDGVLPSCDDPAALGEISRRFTQKEDRFWNSELTIVGFERVRETGFRALAAQAEPRRFCSGYALVSDGLKHPVHYSIGEASGEIGATWGVEWCVVGLDRNWAYNPACKIAKP
jgi:hypothetical protein